MISAASFAKDLTHGSKPLPLNTLNILLAFQTSNVASVCVLCLLDQPVLWLCGWLGPTGCSGSGLGCPSAPGICPYICFTVDSQETDPRRASPLNAQALMSRTDYQMLIKCSAKCQTDRCTVSTEELWFYWQLLCLCSLMGTLATQWTSKFSTNNSVDKRLCKLATNFNNWLPLRVFDSRNFA